ncbi:hypothetical protein D770_04275 [Flammeovirgaceae bacterium 311]|nr:hypothetical protein D770_04275 [Flammeovirgaceae bacterium 311]
MQKATFAYNHQTAVSSPCIIQWTLFATKKDTSMPMETEGWIEFSNYTSQEERDEEHSWLCWMSISSMMLQIDEVTEKLFGYSKRIIRGDYQISSIAKDRGIPLNPSDLVRREIESIQKYIESGEVFGLTTIYYDEIKKNDSILNSHQSEWLAVIELIEKLKNVKKLDDKQIRLIVWFEI